MGRNVLAQVSQFALRHNLKEVRKLAANAKIIAMIKANAYGHGLAKVAKTIHDVDAFGVACIDEALLIRKEGIETNIVLMEGIFRDEELELVQKHHFTLVVHHWRQIQALQQYPKTTPEKFKIWIKINTGMNRLGFSPNEFDEAYTILSTLPHIELMGFMTHFAQADEKNSALTQQQFDLFNHVVGKRPGQRCLANTAGILAWSQTHGDWVRPGLMLYGASPFADSTGKDFNLIPAMTLCSEIIAIRDVGMGEKVGYGGTWENNKKTSKIGIVAFGYGDGYPWHAKNGTPVLVNGQRVQTVGRVSMDMLAVDLSSLNNVEVGAPVILWGKDLPIEEVARHAGTLPYELFCRFTERVQVEIVS